MALELLKSLKKLDFHIASSSLARKFNKKGENTRLHDRDRSVKPVIFNLRDNTLLSSSKNFEPASFRVWKNLSIWSVKHPIRRNVFCFLEEKLADTELMPCNDMLNQRHRLSNAWGYIEKYITLLPDKRPLWKLSLRSCWLC